MNDLELNKSTMVYKKRIVLIRGELETLNLFLEQLKQGFGDLGYEIYEFEFNADTQGIETLLNYINEVPVTVMISFDSPLLAATLPSGEKIWEKFKVPCINILVDHPCRFHEGILSKNPSTGVILCIDRNHMNYVNRFYPNILHKGFLPHGGASLCTSHKPISERKIDVLYAGNLFVSPDKFDFSDWSFPTKQIIEHLIAYPEEAVETAVEQQLLKAGIKLSDEELKLLINRCIFLEDIVNSYYRDKILGAVAKAGISVEIYGGGWQKCDWIGLPNVHCHDRVSPEEVLLKMEDCKIVLNTMHWFKDGSHERVFNAMMCGAVAVSETSKYMEEELPPDTWVSFDLSQESIDALPERIQNLLSDESQMQKIASAGHALAVKKHSWKARAFELHRDLLAYL